MTHKRTPRDATVRRRLSELRSAVIRGPDPVAARIAYAMECAVVWATKPGGVRWPSLANIARENAEYLRKEQREQQ